MNWRSLLYVPANMSRFLGASQTRGADALVLDLEDSVPLANKAEAREVLAAHWRDLRAGPSDMVVRINADLRNAVRDLEAVVQNGLAAVFLPKTSGPEMVCLIADVVLELEAERGLPTGAIKIVPMLETPAALEAAFAVAAAHDRVTGLILGSEDFATACAMLPTPENLFAARQRIVFAARAAGVSPLGLLDSVAALSQDGLRDLVERSRDFGFCGATAVHPAALPHLNAGFAQSETSRAWAKAVIAALDKAAQSGAGAARYEGRMIDQPMRLRAEQILADR